MANNLCYKCGAALPPGAERCPNCGAPAPLSDSEIKRTSTVRAATIIPPQPPANAASTRPITPAEMANMQASTRPITPQERAAAGAVPPLPVMPAPTVQIGIPPTSGAKAGIRPPKGPTGASRGRQAKKGARRKDGSGTGVFAIVGALAVVAVVAVLAWLIIGRKGAPVEDGGFCAVAIIPLRSSMSDDNAGNIIANISAGSKLEVLEQQGQWTKVKAASTDLYDRRVSNSTQGYVATSALVEESDFARIKEIFANTTAAGWISEPHERLALLQYFRANGLTGTHPGGGDCDDSEQPCAGNEWQFRGEYNRTHAEIHHDRIFDENSRYRDLIVVLHNNSTGNNRLVIYSFTDDGTPVFRLEREIGQSHFITMVRRDQTAPDGIRVEFER